jgi:hypothetical protein
LTGGEVCGADDLGATSSSGPTDASPSRTAIAASHRVIDRGRGAHRALVKARGGMRRGAAGQGCRRAPEDDRHE